MKTRRWLSGAAFVCAALCTATLALPAFAQGGQPRDIGPADPLRKVLLDVLRPTVETDLGQPVQFVVRILRVQGDWAFADVAPRTKDGREIDYRKTHHAQRIREGAFDGGYVQALLRNEVGRWTVKDFAVGPTDVYYAGWPDTFGAPYRLFGLKKPD
ncbi:MAG TPA: hypothetical protein VJR58_19815 [Vineibacter sp.]|nr:hypothetical protein [Vineibacter sp.]